MTSKQAGAPPRGRPIGRYALRVLRGVTALLVVAFLAGWYLLETDAAAERVRELLQSRGAAILGEPVSIGRLQLDVLPPRLDLDHVVIGDPNAPLLAVDRALAEFGAVELLARQIAIENIELERPRVNLELPLGDGNGMPGAGLNITVRRARVSDGEVRLGLASAGVDGEVFGVNLRLDPEGVGRLGLGSGRGGGEFSIASGQLDLTSRNGATALLTPLTLSLEYAARPRVVELNAIRLVVGDSSLEAEGALRGLDNLDLRVGADVALTDIFTMWVPPGIQDHAGRATFAGTLQMRDGTPVLAGRLQSGAARFMGLPVEAFDGNLQLQRGLVAVRNARAEIYGGSVSGDFVVDSSVQPSTFSTVYTAAGIDAARFTGWEQIAGLRLAGVLQGNGELEWQQPFFDTVTGAGSLNVGLPDVRNAVSVADPDEIGSVLAAGQTTPAPALPLPGEVSLRYRVAAGTVSIESASADLPGAHLEASGQFDPDGTLRVDANFDGSDLRILDLVVAQVRSISGTPTRRFGLRGAGTARVRLTGTAQAPVLTGTVTARQLAIADLRLGDIDAELETTDGMVATRSLAMRRDGGTASGTARLRLPARGSAAALGLADYDVQLQLSDYSTSLDLQFAGPEWTAEAVLTGDFGLRGLFGQPLTGTARLAGTDVLIAGARFDSIVFAGRKAEEAWLVDRIRLGTGDGSVSASMLYGIPDRILTVDAELERFRMAPFADFLAMRNRFAGPIDGNLRLAGPVNELSGDATLNWTEATVANVALGSVAISLRAERGVIAARATGDPDTMPVPPGTPDGPPTLPRHSPTGWAASGAIETQFPYPATARIAAEAEIARVLLAPAGVVLPADLALEGRAQFDVTTALSDPDQLGGSGTIRGLVIGRGDFTARATSLAATITAAQLDLDGTLQTSAGALEIASKVDLATGRLGGTLSGVLAASALKLLDPELLADGRIDLDIHLAGTRAAPRLNGSVALTDVLVDRGWAFPVSIASAQLRANGDRLQFEAFEGRLGRHPVTLEADFALDAFTGADPDATSTISIAASQVALGPLFDHTPAVQRLISGGSVSAVANLAGRGPDPRDWAGTISVSELALRMQQYRVALGEPAVARIGHGALTLPPTTRLVGGDTDFALSGSINLDTFALDLRADGSLGFEALNVLSPYWGTGGVADVDVRILGAPGDPAYRGFATLRDVVLSPPVIRQPVEDVSARLDFEDRRVLITEMRGALGGGDVAGTGEIFLRNNYPQSFRIDVSVDAALIRLERNVRFTASADLVHDGTPERSLLSGTVNLLDAQYRREYDSDRELLELLDAPETEPNPFLDSIRLAVAVRGTEGLFVNNNLADVESAADLDVRGTVARPVVLGRASILSGRLFWNGNNFDVLQGVVEFNNPFETEATFEIRSRTEIRRYTIDMRFSGSLTRGVDFDYTSTPTLSDLELFNLLAFGEEPDSATLQDPDRYQQALGLQATRYLTDAYFTEVESGARRLFGVDRFRIAPTISGKETDATARVTLGKRINRNVYLTYSRLLSTSEDQLITVEYQVSPKLRIKGTRDEDGSFGIDFLVQQRIRR
jgi:hypothetical protein